MWCDIAARAVLSELYEFTHQRELFVEKGCYFVIWYDLWVLLEIEIIWYDYVLFLKIRCEIGAVCDELAVYATCFYLRDVTI